MESTFKIGGSTDTPLGEFLHRPVKIFEINPALATTSNVAIKPWEVFLNDPNVKRRIEGFRHVRGRLHLRAVCTGNPFLFGMYALSYRPFRTRSVHALCGAFSDARMIQTTSCPHIFIDPTTSEGGEMVLPFFTPYNWIDLTETNMMGDMGTLFFETLVPLKHANSGSGSFNVQIYAWMEDAEICTPTVATYGSWTLQSMTEQPQNEFAEKPVSTVATAVAKGAGLLSHVPGIGPYAKATEMGAKVTSAVAKAFGYSRPREVSDVTRVRSVRNGDFCTTNTSDPIPRLGLDFKGELTVDPRTVGLDSVDEMSIQHIVQKEAAFTKVTWNESDSAGTSLQDIAVTPLHGDTDTTTTPARTVLVPCAGIASLFQFWSGTLIFRFKVVASALHRGKLRISYDPVSTALGGTNEQYTRIVDLSTTRDFEVPVNWHATMPWLEVADIPIGTPGNLNNSPTIASIDPKESNGVISLTVFTPLTSPDPAAGQSVTIICSVRAGEDFRVARPANFDSRKWSYRSSDPTELPQSLMDDSSPPQDNMPVGATPQESIGPASTPSADMSSLVFMGEHITSLRSFLKRYRYHSLSPSTATILARRNIPVGGTTSMGVQEYILNWYTGYRGSWRMRAMRVNDSLFQMTPTVDGILPGVSTGAGDVGCEYQYGMGEVEIPFYSNYRFALAQANPYFAASTYISDSDPNLLGIQTADWTSLGSSVTRYSAVGEDFSLFFFTGIPPLYG